MKLIWTNEQPANEDVRYNHVISETPFGRFLITWKGWKDNPNSSITIDETPWGECYLHADDLNGYKQICEDEFNKRLLECNNLPQEQAEPIQ